MGETARPSGRGRPDGPRSARRNAWNRRCASPYATTSRPIGRFGGAAACGGRVRPDGVLRSSRSAGLSGGRSVRPCHPRHHDARHGRLRAARTHPSAARAHLDARAVPHGERRAFRSRVGTHVGRRRLHREAVSAPRAGAAHRRRAAPLLLPPRTAVRSWLRAA
mgnify:CR=1 FL=1